MTDDTPKDGRNSDALERSSDATRDGSDAGISRRDLLRGTVAAGAIGASGCQSVASDGLPFVGPSITPAEAPLETPWFEDVSDDDPHAEYPRPQMVRERWKHLNGVWGFEPVEGGDAPPEGRALDEDILVPFPVQSALSGIGREEDHVWYRRTFGVPGDWSVGGGADENDLLLHFEAVDYETTIYLNGEDVGSHVGGYDHFAYDVSEALTDGRRQELVVEVVDRTEEGQTLGKQHENDGSIWYTPTTGIWQSVWLEPVPASRIESLDLTPDLDAEALRVGVETAGADGLTVAATASEDGTEVAAATGTPDEPLSLSIPEPRTWSPDDPFLYDLSVELRRDGTPVDAVESYFGMRSVGTERIGPDVRTTLNGEFSFALGTLDQGFWPDGIYTAPTDEALAFDLEKHIELGFNAVRKHVKIEPRRWYYHADRLGLIVIQDMPSTADFSDGPDAAEREQFERELRAMVEGLGNHPSITTWVPFNEGWGVYDLERISDTVAEWDPERLVIPNSGSNVAGGDCGCGDILDAHNYPGPDPAPTAEERATVLGEFGGLGLAVEDHRWGDGEFSYATYVTAGELTSAYVESLERIEQLLANCGLSAAIYTQITDVENENNGLLTYDRKVVKPAESLVRQANRSVIEAAKGYEPPSPADASSERATPVAHWPLDEGEGEMAADAIGGNDGTFVGDPTWTDGRTGSALSFDNAFVETGGPVLDTFDAYSVAAWVRLADPAAIKTAVSQGGDQFSAFSLGYVESADRLAFTAMAADRAGTEVRALAPEPPENDRWYHLVGVRDRYDRAIRLYVDGERVDEQPFCPGFESSGSFVIGSGMRNGLLLSNWEGAVDDVRAFDRALDDEAVATLHEQG